MKTTRVLAGVIAALSFVPAACGDSTPTQPTQPRAEYAQSDLRVGTGDEAVTGKTLTVNYAGWLYNPTGPDGKGRLFDTNVRGGSPFAFTLGTGAVIGGWDRGVAGMLVGGVRRLVIPPELAYGEAGSPPTIPANATLIFDVELVSVQ
jgi:FKBP-type peptidyl-prolyl cis-trans isomerase